MQELLNQSGLKLVLAKLIFILTNNKIIKCIKNGAYKRFCIWWSIWCIEEINNEHNKLYEYKPRSSNKFNIKYEMLEYLKSAEIKLIDMLSTPGFAKK